MIHRDGLLRILIGNHSAHFDIPSHQLALMQKTMMFSSWTDMYYPLEVTKYPLQSYKVRSRTHPDEDPQQAKPCYTEKLVYVYSNRKMAATVRDADELKMFAWDNEDV
jgi:hypothetical protein